MNAVPRTVGDFATARSGDKGEHANLAVVARDRAAFELLAERLTAERVAAYFASLEPSRVERFVLPRIESLNFVLYHVLHGGASRSLRLDTQGKLLGTQLLEMPLPEIGEAHPTW